MKHVPVAKDYLLLGLDLPGHCLSMDLPLWQGHQSGAALLMHFSPSCCSANGRWR